MLSVVNSSVLRSGMAVPCANADIEYLSVRRGVWDFFPVYIEADIANVARINNLNSEGNRGAGAGKLQPGFVLAFNVLIERLNADANLLGLKRPANRELSGRVHPV